MDVKKVADFVEAHWLKTYIILTILVYWIVPAFIVADLLWFTGIFSWPIIGRVLFLGGTIIYIFLCLVFIMEILSAFRKLP